MFAPRTGLCWESDSLKCSAEIQKTPNFSMSSRSSRLLLQMFTTMPTEVPSPMTPSQNLLGFEIGIGWQSGPVPEGRRAFYEESMMWMR